MWVCQVLMFKWENEEGLLRDGLTLEILLQPLHRGEHVTPDCILHEVRGARLSLRLHWR